MTEAELKAKPWPLTQLQPDDGNRNAMHACLSEAEGVSTPRQILDLLGSEGEYFKGRVFLELIWEVWRLRQKLQACRQIVFDPKYGGDAKWVRVNIEGTVRSALPDVEQMPLSPF